MSIRPLHDFIVVKPEEVKEQTEGGLFIPQGIDDGKPVQGEVVAVGPGLYNQNNERIPVNLNVGATVMYGKKTAMEVEDGGVNYDMVRINDIMGVVDA